MKTRKSIYLENINPNELNVIFSKIVSEGFYCDKVWGISIFPSCIPIRGIKSKSLLTRVKATKIPVRLFYQSIKEAREAENIPVDDIDFLLF